MSDELVKRLRDMSNYYNSGGRFVAADRIEELEAKLAKAREEGFWAGRSCGGTKKEIDAALAELKGQNDE